MPRNVLYPNDYKFGTAQEDLVLPKLKAFFGREIKKSEDKFAKSDYYDDEYYYEMKSRKVEYNRYPTTMITEDKLRDDKKLVLLFNFTDGMYFIEYDKEKFDKYERQMFSRAGYKWNEKPHLYIDIKDLQPILV